MMESESTILDGSAAAAQPGVQPEGAERIAPAVTEQPQAQPAQPGGYDYAGMVGGGGALAENWREGLPESIRGEKCLDSIKTIGTLAQSYVHAQKAIGANKVAIPGENASPEEIDAFQRALGRPEQAADYKADNVKLPEGIELDPVQLEEFRKFAFANGIPQKLFEAGLAYDVQRLEKQIEQRQAARDAEYHETLGKLRSEFGGGFETVVAQCNRAMEVFGLTDVLREHGLLNNYTIIKALAGIGERIGESKLRGEGGQAVSGNPQSRLSEIQGNPDDPFYKKDHPLHQARVTEVNQLLAMLARKQ